MRVPVPKNKLVAFTLVGALLTAGVAGALALPGGGLAQVGEQPNSSDASQQVTADAPTPNQGFAPAVQTQSGYEDEEHEEYEEDDEEEHEEEHEEYEEDDEEEHEEEHEEYEEDDEEEYEEEHEDEEHEEDE